jgi:F-type H+-transporting ATPase subunit gamma
LTDVRRRVFATRQIAKATSALEKVAAVRLARARRGLDGLRLYHDRLEQLIADLRAAHPHAEHPFLRRGPGATPLVIVFGSERGLCGPFNILLLDALDGLLRSLGGSAARVVAVGKVTARRARRLGHPVVETAAQPLLRDLFPQPGSPAPGPAAEGTVTRLASMATSSFLGGDCPEVHVLFSRFVSGLSQVPTPRRLLPVGPQRRPGGPHAPAAEAWARAAGFEPGLDSLLAGLLPHFVETALFHAAAHSLASENAARQAAMTRATDNARDMLDRLMTEACRRRQEGITKELLEIARG